MTRTPLLDRINGRKPQHNHSLTDIRRDGSRYTVRYDRGCGGCDADRPEWVKRAQERRLPAADWTPR